MENNVRPTAEGVDVSEVAIADRSILVSNAVRALLTRMPWEQANALADPFWPWAVVCLFLRRVLDHSSICEFYYMPPFPIIYSNFNRFDLKSTTYQLKAYRIKLIIYN